MNAGFVLSILISGIIAGGIYSLLGLAIVLLIRTTGVSNFAQGAIGMLGAFMFYMYFLRLPIPLWAAWLLTVVAGGGVGCLIYFLLMKPNAGAGHLALTVRTLGLFMLLYASAVYLWAETEPYNVPSLFPTGLVSLGNLRISYDQLGTLGFMTVLAAGFLLFFRFTDVGLAMRAVATNAVTASLLGINVGRVQLVAWVIAGSLGVMTGLLVAPISFLDTALMKTYILKAFTAAVLGGLSSFPGVIVGGLLLGVTEAVSATYLPLNLRDGLSFAILLMILLFRPAGLFGRPRQARV